MEKAAGPYGKRTIIKDGKLWWEFRETIGGKHVLARTGGLFPSPPFSPEFTLRANAAIRVAISAVRRAITWFRIGPSGVAMVGLLDQKIDELSEAHIRTPRPLIKKNGEA